MQPQKQISTQQINLSVPNLCDYITSNDTSPQQLQSSSPQTECNLYLGGVQSLTDSELQKHKVTAILTIMTDKEKKKAKLQQKIDDLFSLNRHNQLMCHETTSLGPYFQSAIEFVNDSWKYKMSVIVHCKDGNSKSALLVAAFLVYKFKISAEKAVEVVTMKRPSACITEEYIRQLKEYEDKLHKMK